jgi:hypothetical protein
LPSDRPIEIRAVIEGPADEVMRLLQKLGRSPARLEAHVTCRVLDSRSRRWHESFGLPVIADGDFEKAAEQVDRLARQNLIEPEVERELDRILPTLRDLTKAGF